MHKSRTSKATLQTFGGPRNYILEEKPIEIGVTRWYLEGCLLLINYVTALHLISQRTKTGAYMRNLLVLPTRISLLIYHNLTYVYGII